MHKALQALGDMMKTGKLKDASIKTKVKLKGNKSAGSKAPSK